MSRPSANQIIAAELEARGGTCQKEGCEQTKVEWHHRKPETKEFSIGSARAGRDGNKLRAELAKCDPLCAEHHRELHGRMTNPGHGTLSRYMNQQCRCAKCRKANRDYYRAYRARQSTERKSCQQ